MDTCNTGPYLTKDEELWNTLYQTRDNICTKKTKQFIALLIIAIFQPSDSVNDAHVMQIKMKEKTIT